VGKKSSHADRCLEKRVVVSGEESCGVWRRELWCLEKRVVVSGEESCGVWRRELWCLEKRVVSFGRRMDYHNLSSSNKTN